MTVTVKSLTLWLAPFRRFLGESFAGFRSCKDSVSVSTSASRHAHVLSGRGAGKSGETIPHEQGGIKDEACAVQQQCNSGT